MTFFCCEKCGTTWSAPPLLRSDGAHETWDGRLCRAIPQKAIPASKAHPTAGQFDRAIAEKERAIMAAEKLASRLQVLTVELHQLSRASGRNLQRFIEAQRRAAQAEGALRAAETTPARAVRLLRALSLLLARLERSRCPICRTRHCASCLLRERSGHRRSCRVMSAQRRVWELVQGDR
jgi:DNA repair exonuclease SbcCD ATPase subunit